MAHLIGDIYGLIHLISSIVALISGTFVLIIKKGTKRHKQVGYVYVLSMAILILTAFMIYRLFNKWGVFHYATIGSLITIVLGMIPVWTKKQTKNWVFKHFSFMYWSIIGLYMAFTAEVLTRIPETPFWEMVVTTSVIIMIIGRIFFRINKPKWAKQFGTKK